MRKVGNDRRGRSKHFLAACAFAMALHGCGGGGGSSSGVVSTPPPPPPPPPPPSAAAIIPTATSSQQFATAGAAYATPLAAYDEFDVANPALGEAAQLDVRYNAATLRYEVQLPDSASWREIRDASSSVDAAGAQWVFYREDTGGLGVDHYRSPSSLEFSALLRWFTDQGSGYSAIGVATLPGAVPSSGSATYAGSIVGSSSELGYDPWEAVWWVGSITGSINLAFNFGSGSLSGNINPLLNGQALPSLSFADTVYSAGSVAFQGRFATNLAGVNSFSGRFTGPAAQEVIGSFAFPYTSPGAGTPEQAAGAFAGRRQ